MAESNPICSICLERFKDPTTIPCNHVFCYVCLKRHVENNAKEGSYACPLCNRAVTVSLEAVSSVKKEGVQEKNVSKKNDSPKCDACGSKRLATSRCQECEENYCQVCSALHINMKASRNHTLRELGVPDQSVTLHCREFCPKHPEEEVKIVCKECNNIPLCLFCKISKHDSHTSKILAEEVGEVKNILETSLLMCSNKLEQLQILTTEGISFDSIIDTSEKEEITTVNKQEFDLIRLLEDQKLKIKQEAQNVRECIKLVYDKVRNDNADRKNKIAKEYSDCVIFKKEARKFIDSLKDSQIVQTGRNLAEKILRESRQSGNIKLLYMQRKAFTPAGVREQTLEISMGKISVEITIEKMNIFLKSYIKEEPMILLEIDPEERIGNLKKRVTEKYPLIPGSTLVLEFDRREMIDSYSVHQYGTSNGSTIECFWRETLQKEKPRFLKHKFSR